MTTTNQVGGFSTEIAVTPVISTSIYASGDQLGDIQTLAYLSPTLKPMDAACQDKTVSFLSSLVIIDAAGQSAPLNIYFFNALPTVVSVDNGVLNISAAELKAKCRGFMSVLATDYAIVGSASIATLNMARCGLAIKSNTDDGPLYAVAQIMGAKTYAAVSDLVFIYDFSQDLGNGRGV